MKSEFICRNQVFSFKHPLIIAELGTAHMGSIEKAFRLIDSVAGCGCDAVKFQIVYADEILHPKSGYVKLPQGDVLLYDKFKELECPSSFYAELARYAHSKSLMFSASVFGMRSLEDLVSLHPDFFKVASPELNYHALIRKIALYNLPIILSTGVSRLADIEMAIEAVSSVNKEVSLAILHCITSYPAPETEYNLSLIKNLFHILGVPVGLSDHSLHPFFIPLLSLAFGGCIIEKHLCLSKKEEGLDDKIALEPSEFSLMCKNIRKMEGEGLQNIKDFLLENGIEERLINDAIGTGEKKLALAEHKNYERTNRSLHYVHDMKEGERIDERDIVIVRTEKVLSVGLSPQLAQVVIGARLQKCVNAGDGVAFDDIIAR